MVKIGVVGYGYWGPNLVRNFFKHDLCSVEKVADTSRERLSHVDKLYPSVDKTTRAEDILEDKEIDAVALATPVSTHYALAAAALKAGKHVLIEKPMTTRFSQAQELVQTARERKLTLMVDHTFVYTSAVGKIKELIETKQLGRVTYFDSMRTNLGLFQKDVNVLWDLAAHDISILMYLLNERPHAIQAIGAVHTAADTENMGFIVLKYKSGLIAHINCSWSSPVKIRMTLIGGDKKMIVYNDIEPTEKVKVYDTGHDIRRKEGHEKLLIDYRVGDVVSPKVEVKEALETAVSDFIQAILQKKNPLSDGRLGMAVVDILEHAGKSLQKGGREVKLPQRA